MNHNHYFAIVIVFMLSQFLHIFVKAAGARVSTLNGINSYAQYLDEYGKAITGRLIFAFGFLLVWIQNPEVLTVWANKVPWVVTHLGHVNLTLNPGLALVFGYNVDSILDKLPVAFPWLRPWLGKEVAPIDLSEVK